MPTVEKVGEYFLYKYRFVIRAAGAPLHSVRKDKTMDCGYFGIDNSSEDEGPCSILFCVFFSDILLSSFILAADS